MKKIFFYPLVLVLFFACQNDDNESTTILSDCDGQSVIIDRDQFNNAPNDDVTINRIVIEGDCMEITYSASGCDGNSWEVNLIDSEIIAKSLPGQRSVRLSLKDEELCEAFITQSRVFDISNLQAGGDEVWLNIEGYEERVIYKY